MLLFNTLTSTRDGLYRVNASNFLSVYRDGTLTYTRSINKQNAIKFSGTDLYNLSKVRWNTKNSLYNANFYYKGSKVTLSYKGYIARIHSSFGYLHPFKNYCTFSNTSFTDTLIINIKKDGVYKNNTKVKSFPSDIEEVYLMMQAPGSAGRGNVVYWVWVVLWVGVHCYSGAAGASGAFGLYRVKLSDKFFIQIKLGNKSKGGVYRNTTIEGDGCTSPGDSWVSLIYYSGQVFNSIKYFYHARMGERKVNIGSPSNVQAEGGKLTTLSSMSSSALTAIIERNGMNGGGSTSTWYTRDSGVTLINSIAEDESIPDDWGRFYRGNYRSSDGWYGNEYYTQGGTPSVLASGGNQTGNADSDSSAHGRYGSGGGAQGTINAGSHSGNGGEGYICIGW